MNYCHHYPKEAWTWLFFPQDLNGVIRPTRMKVQSTWNEQEVNAEKAVQAKRQRAGHIGELRKRRNQVQELLASPNVEVKEVETSVARYEEAFHNFVCSHDNYLLYEDDEEKKELMLDSYNNQRDMKLQLNILVNNWRAKRKRMNRPSSESGFSLTSAKSDKSCASRNSVKEKKRVIEEIKLETQALQEKQELQRRIEEVESGVEQEIEVIGCQNKSEAC